MAAALCIYTLLMKKLILLYLIGLICITVSAKNRTAEELKSIAAQQLFGYKTQAATRAQTIDLKLYAETDQYSIYGNESKGFVVLSRNDAFNAVLGVSSTPFVKDAMPCGFEWWISEISDAMKRNAPALSKERIATRAGFSVVDPFITTVWGQDTPFNKYTPRVNDQNTPTGCVATAMSQIMYNYKYPASGKGLGTYTYGSKSRTSTISTTYAWNNMIADYSGRSTVIQQTAVAYLMRDAGYATCMNYDTDGSGAYENYAAAAFGNNFRYDSLAVKLYNRAFYAQDEWMEIIYRELAAKEPILYCGIDRQAGGHAFIFDGIDATGKVHINWGWDGSANGYYDVSALNPTGTTYSFTIGQRMILGFIPNETPAPGETITSQWVSSERLGFEKIDNNNVTVSIADMYNLHYRDFLGSIGLYFVNESKKDTLVYGLLDSKEDSIGSTPYQYGFNFTDDEGNPYSFDIDITDLEPGTYRVFLGSKAYQEPTATPFRYYEGEYAYTLTKEDNATGVQSVPIDPSSQRQVDYFDVSGKKVSKSSLPKNGVVIMKYGNQIQKVLSPTY